MKLSTRSRYGIRALLELAVVYGNGPLQLKSIAQHQNISAKYLEHLVAILKAAGILKSVRGAKGGYVLAKPPSQITLSECFNCLEGAVVTVECLENENYCARADDCVMKQVWSQVQDAIANVLQSLTLQDLVAMSKKPKALNYHI